MISQYLVLAIVLAVTLNHRNLFVRAAGTLLITVFGGNRLEVYGWVVPLPATAGRAADVRRMLR